MSTQTFNKKQEATYNMIQRVDDAGLSHSAFVDSVPALKRHYHRLRTLRQEITSASSSRRSSRSATRDKASCRAGLNDMLSSVGSFLLSLANDSGDSELRELAKRAPNEYERLRDGDVPAVAQALSEAARTHARELEGYGLDAETLLQFEATAGRFAELSPKPVNAIGQGKTKTVDLKSLFTAANTLLHDSMDPLVRGLLKKQPDFANAYFSARAIRDNAVRPRPAAGA